MTKNNPTFQFIEPASEYKGLIRRIILGYSDHDINIQLPIRPTGFAYFTYSRYPEDITLHYSKKAIKSIGKLGLANQILGENPFFEIAGNFYQIGIELFPHIPYSLFGLKGNQLLNKIHVFPPDDEDNRTIVKQLDALEEPGQVALLMQKYLWRKSREVEVRQDIIAILNEIYESNGQIQVSDLAEKHQVSTRHLRRLFSDHIGLTPKQYSMVIQFNYVQQRLLNGSNNGYGSYYDQAHFTKICKRITGYTPSELMKQDNGFLSGYLK